MLLKVHVRVSVCVLVSAVDIGCNSVFRVVSVQEGELFFTFFFYRERDGRIGGIKDVVKSRQCIISHDRKDVVKQSFHILEEVRD